MKTITVTIQYTMQRASNEDCDRYGKPRGMIEVLNPDSTREFFAPTEVEATDGVRAIYDELYFGPFDLEVSE